MRTRSLTTALSRPVNTSNLKPAAPKKWQKEILSSFYLQNPYPDEEDLETLARESKLTHSQIENWFAKELRKNPAPTLAISAYSSVSSSTLSTRNVSKISTNSIQKTSSSHFAHSPSLGYIPSAFSLSGSDFAEPGLAEVDLHSWDIEYSVENASQPLVSSQSACLQMLSQVTEELNSEAEADAALGEAMAQSNAAYNHDYSSFFAGVPTQPSFNINDFSAYSLSTMPSQTSAMINTSLAHPFLRDAVTKGVLRHHQLSETRSQPQPVAVGVKMSELRAMSRRITEKYDASLKAAQVQEESRQELLDWASSGHEHRLEGGLVSPSELDAAGDTEDEGHEAITPSGTTESLPSLDLKAFSRGCVPAEIIDNSRAAI